MSLDCPFEYHYYTSSMYDESIYGRLIIIPNFYTDSGLEYLRNVCLDFGVCDDDVYPNQRIAVDVSSEKVDWLYDNWQRFSVSTELHGVDYVFEGDNNVPHRINHHIQVSPAHMRPYPIHNDGGKQMTCLVPLYPHVNNSTVFHGTKIPVDNVPPYMIPWEVNTAYLFRSSNKSWHSYVGGDTDRFVANINFFDKTYKG